MPPRSAWWADWRFWLGIAVSAACLWLAFRNVRWAELAAAVAAVDWTLIVLAFLVALFDQFVRSLRWRVLLAPVGRVSVADSFSYLSIGALANSLLPLRAGEIIRPVLLGEKCDLSKSAVLATVVVERLLDVLTLVAVALLLLASMPIPAAVKNTVWVFGVAGLSALLALWWIAGQLSQHKESRLAGWAKTFGRRLAGSPEQPRRLLGVDVSALLRKGWAMVLSFVDGLGVMRSPRLAASTGLYTLVAWSASLATIWLVLRACHLDLPWTASLMALVIVNFGAAIPSSPGALGVMHVLAMLALTPWNVAQSQALTFAIMIHAVVFAMMVVVGLACLVREGIGFSQMAGSGKQAAAPGAADPEPIP